MTLVGTAAVVVPCGNCELPTVLIARVLAGGAGDALGLRLARLASSLSSLFIIMVIDCKRKVVGCLCLFFNCLLYFGQCLIQV